MDEAHKKVLNISRLKYNEVNFEATFEGPPNYSKFRCFYDDQMQPQN